ncbi:hypothetical protein JTB14_009355 [Gonioctena quinquepunctata]|nr:hypothetical protein JTB14_009355 [Gonioctena quinquepunctata]
MRKDLCDKRRPTGGEASNAKHDNNTNKTDQNPRKTVDGDNTNIGSGELVEKKTTRKPRIPILVRHPDQQSQTNINSPQLGFFHARGPQQEKDGTYAQMLARHQIVTTNTQNTRTYAATTTRGNEQQRQ